MSLEQEIKKQFARTFTASDWQLFKQMAEFYLPDAVSLRIADIAPPQHLELLARNSRKRLYAGIGTELLLKALYLKRGYQINKLARDQRNPHKFPYTFGGEKSSTLKEDETCSD